LLNVQIKLVRPGLFPKNGEPMISVPEYKTAMSAGVDLQAAIADPVEIWPNSQPTMIPTGVAIFINDPNYVAQIHPRSGLGSKGLVLGNLTGIIDADYQGELLICAWNRGPLSSSPIVIAPSDRIAQLIFLPIARAKFHKVDEFSLTSERGAGGWGSTGR